MITNLIASVVLILIVFCFYISFRNNKVYCFNVNLCDFLFNEMKRILDTYKNDGEFNDDEKNYFNIRKKVQVLLDKNSYNKYLFSFKPLKIDRWFTKEELDFIEYLKQYRR